VERVFLEVSCSFNLVAILAIYAACFLGGMGILIPNPSLARFEAHKSLTRVDSNLFSFDRSLYLVIIHLVLGSPRLLTNPTVIGGFCIWLSTSAAYPWIRRGLRLFSESPSGLSLFPLSLGGVSSQEGHVEPRCLRRHRRHLLRLGALQQKRCKHSGTFSQCASAQS